MTVYERFLKYVSYPTTSDENNENCPSTEGQRVLAQELCRELLELGISDARVDEHGYVYASIPASCEGMDSIGFIAHMDTASEASGENIKAKMIDYQGGDILLNEKEVITLKVEDYPFVSTLSGQRLIVTDGTTLLGADDKAGIAEIMTAAEKIIKSEIKHGKICIGFTPDEEIGRGADLFDVEGFGADYAYTLDGGALGEIEYENFNAASAVVSVHGRAIHPGSAKGKMINAARILAEFDSMLSPDEIPERTEGYEGFHHLLSIEGETEKGVSRYIIRDHSMEKFLAKKAEFELVADKLNKKYGDGVVELSISDSYYNMKEVLLDKMFVVDRAKSAMERIGITPVTLPIRGGTDGARLSFMGLPCPNLPTGGGNYHSRFEYVSVDAMEKCVELILEIVKG
ncbi:MAG: peptidase T [Ruminococcaceae bacterium]|nr:peptidase T [Oscillospiraceae bacterium]